MDLNEVSERSVAIRVAYHALEREYHGSEWSIEEDALAFFDRCQSGRTLDDES